MESFVMRMSETETTGTIKASTSNVEDRPADRTPPAGKQAKATGRMESPWPFNLGDVTPLEWWRTMPADYLGSGQHLHLRATLETICAMNGHQWLSALRGDAAASIAIAIGAMPRAAKTDVYHEAFRLAAENPQIALIGARVLGLQGVRRLLVLRLIGGSTL